MNFNTQLLWAGNVSREGSGGAGGCIEDLCYSSDLFLQLKHQINQKSPMNRGDTESALSLKPWRCLHGPRLRSTLPFCKGLKSCSRGVLIESPGSSLHFLSQATGSPERRLQSRLHAARPRGTQRQWPWNGTVCPDADYIWSSRLLLLCMRGSRGQWMVEHLRFLVSPSCQLTNKGIKGFKTANRKAFYFYFCA